ELRCPGVAFCHARFLPSTGLLMTNTTLTASAGTLRRGRPARARLGVGGRGGRGQLRHRELLDVGVRSGERLVLGVVDDAGGVDPVEGAGREIVTGATL